ncbi:MAG: Rieske (2Fe-2S) protein [Sedimentisphaerales bacterium]|nr:Rieske (2Fe-2S) protein [Sedimentisphaerales bacterium]
MMRQDKTSRRDLLRFGAAVAACACAGCEIPAAREVDIAAEPVQGVIRLTQEQSATLLASEGSLLIKPKGRRGKILVVHHPDGTLHAVSAACTHMGCTVDYDKDKGCFVCPCHKSEFAWDGSVLHGPASRPLKQYDVTTDSGQVLIKV